MKLKKTELKYFRKLILEKRDALLKELGALKESTIDESSRKSSGAPSSYSYHMADLGTDSHEREKAYLFLARENKYLAHLNEALERVDAGNYGICKSCGQPIPKARLEAVPNATLCVPCKVKEKESAN